MKASILFALLSASSVFAAVVPQQDFHVRAYSDAPTSTTSSVIPCPTTPAECASRLDGHLICLNARTWCRYTDTARYTPAFFPVDLNNPYPKKPIEYPPTYLGSTRSLAQPRPPANQIRSIARNLALTDARISYMMPLHNGIESEDAKQAQLEAVRGAGYGALKWGAATAALGGLGYVMSPVYRGLTVQFKLYLQMSGMILGGMIEADSRMRRYEQHIRMQRRIARDRAMWDSYEKELMEDDEPPPTRNPAPKK
ncbi:hypothetical protein F5Y19DRAFT_471529 [Xylariaceae sp. FL1651]|nr:hypothetical protein F5Y19DRAFT_471529 [Xylariaceae sp. FL1651]